MTYCWSCLEFLPCSPYQYPFVLLQKLAKFELIQYDIDQNEVVRNEKGFCIPVATGETGLLVGKITKKTPFHGYAGDLEKTKKKLLQDVLEKGDSYFNSGHEGKIGMAAIRLKEGESFDGKQLYEHTKNYLPNYAIPHFIRIQWNDGLICSFSPQEALEVTGTFKQCKTRLVKEEFDPITITEPLFFLDNSEKSFVPLTLEIYHSITEKKRKL
ncbi:hypothetical protein E2320_002999 [Naja naja]|nr:hypothetical protein E2320_002999 [Naja naja]